MDVVDRDTGCGTPTPKADPSTGISAHDLSRLACLDHYCPCDGEDHQGRDGPGKPGLLEQITAAQRADHEVDQQGAAGSKGGGGKASNTAEPAAPQPHDVRVKER